MLKSVVSNDRKPKQAAPTAQTKRPQSAMSKKTSNTNFSWVTMMVEEDVSEEDEHEDTPEMIGEYEICWDDTRNLNFYFHTMTQQSIWKLPDDLAAELAARRARARAGTASTGPDVTFSDDDDLPL